MIVAHTPELIVITGSMFAGKSEELLRQLRRAKVIDKPFLLVKPRTDTRSKNTVESHSGFRCRAKKIGTSADLWKLVKPEHRIVAIDEAQFFDDGLPEVVMQIVRSGRRVIVAGLALNFREQPYLVMAHLLCLATTIVKLDAECTQCGERKAHRSHLLAPSDSLVIIGGKDKYAARCLHCFVPPSSP